jgi:hypothetical protein
MNKPEIAFVIDSKGIELLNKHLDPLAWTLFEAQHIRQIELTFQKREPKKKKEKKKEEVADA